MIDSIYLLRTGYYSPGYCIFVKFRSQHCLIIHDVQSIKQKIPKTANENDTLISLASNTDNGGGTNTVGVTMHSRL